jgi:hypothetical protein
MEIQYILFIAFVALAVFIANFLNKKGGLKKEKKAEFLPYIKRTYLLTPAEHEFFNTLEKVVEGKYYIFPQVVLADIVKLKGKGYFKPSYRTKIDKKTVDFVLFDKKNISPILVIELDDYTHQRQKRKKRDVFLNKVLDICKIQILHTSLISEMELKAIITEKLK